MNLNPCIFYRRRGRRRWLRRRYKKLHKAFTNTCIFYFFFKFSCVNSKYANIRGRRRWWSHRNYCLHVWKRLHYNFFCLQFFFTVFLRIHKNTDSIFRCLEFENRLWSVQCDSWGWWPWRSVLCKYICYCSTYDPLWSYLWGKHWRKWRKLCFWSLRSLRWHALYSPDCHLI